MPAPSSFRRAEARRINLKIALCGPSKAGKTYDAIRMADVFLKELAEAKVPASYKRGPNASRIAVIDSENGRSEYYADMVEGGFDVNALYQFKPESYIAALSEATVAGYGFLVIDSITHEWAGPGGLLSDKDAIIKSGSVRNDWAAFGIITPRHNAFLDAIVRYPGHLIATIRADMDYVLATNAEGKNVPQKVGLGPTQRKGAEYEFDVFGMIAADHSITFDARGPLAEALCGRTWQPQEIDAIAKILAGFIAGNHGKSPDGVTEAEIEYLKRFGREALGMGDEHWSQALSAFKVASWAEITREKYVRMESHIRQRAAERAEANATA